MLKEIKELKKISKKQKKMSNMLEDMYKNLITERKTDLVFNDYNFYEDLTEDENTFFVETVFNLIERQLNNELEDVMDINFYHHEDIHKTNIFLDLEKDPNSITKAEWGIHITMEKGNGVINLVIKDEEIILDGIDVDKINNYIDKLKEEYTKLKKQDVIKSFDFIIKKTKLSRSEFLNNLDFLEDE